MAETDPPPGPATATPPPQDGEDTPDARIAVLRERGASGFDPVRWRFIEAFGRRASSHGGVARQRLDARLLTHLAAYGERFETACRDAAVVLTVAVARFPDAAAALKRLHAAGDFAGLDRFIAARGAGSREVRPLADLVAHIARQAAEQGADGADDEPDAGVERTGAGTQAPGAAGAGAGAGAALSELRTLKRFRSTWSRLSADRKMTRAAARLPGNAGPLNSHALALRALQKMQEVSPQYLARFMGYLDTLLWLERAEDAAVSAQKEPGAARADGASEKKRRAGPRKSG